MAPAPTPQMPGNLTVPVLFGWENLVTVVVLAVVTAVLFVVALAAAAAGSRRSEWRAWLDSRPTGDAVSIDGTRSTPTRPDRQLPGPDPARRPRVAVAGLPASGRRQAMLRSRAAGGGAAGPTG